METKKYFATDKFGDRNFIKVELSYSKGGLNYWTYKHDERGLYIHVKPVERSADGLMEGFTISGQASDGYRACLQQLGRKNDKALASLWEKIVSGAEEIARLFEAGKIQESVNLAYELAR